MKKLLLFIFVFLLIPSKLIKAQWTQQYSGDPSILFTINMMDNNTGYAAGDYENILKTTNGGADWSVIHQGSSDDFHADMFFLDSQTGWTVLGGWSPFRHGYILKTTDGGDSWIIQLYLDGYLFISIFFIDDQKGWAVGTNGIIYYTSNGGNNWEFQYQLYTDEWLYDVYFIDQNNGWAVGNLGSKMLRTTDSGNSWQWLWIPTSDFLLDIEMVDQSKGITVGENGRILTSTNGGNSWSIAQSGTSSFFRDVEFSSPNEAWVVGYGGVILYTSDIGNTWQAYPSGTTTDLYSASFISELQGWVCGNDQLILNNTSGIPVELISFSAVQKDGQIQLSWTTATETNNFGFEIERKTSYDWEKLGFVEGMGTTTETQYYSYMDDIVRLNFTDKLYYRLKQLDLDGSYNYSNEVEVTVIQINKYFLHQNFPNPFNPSTTITFDLLVNSNVVLKVFNSLGEQVAELANGEYFKGNYQVILDASNLSSGLYIYKIQAKGEDGNIYTESKKMMVMK